MGRRSKKLGTNIQRNREILVERLVKDGRVDDALRVIARKLEKNLESTARYVLDQVMGGPPRKTELSGTTEVHVKAKVYLPEKGSFDKKGETASK